NGRSPEAVARDLIHAWYAGDSHHGLEIRGATRA
ncbi:MAG: hypothetical protein JWM36_3415, partial [Hyphomicrobiales bacterium]|nr:hypothetical protein [Hyphomicrobiales bacterium]